MEQKTFTRKELYELVWSKPFSTLSTEYAISDVGLRKICLKMDIPLPGLGYWMKTNYNKKVKKKYLPSNLDVVQQITLTNRDIEKHVNSHLLTQLKHLIEEIENTPGLPLVVPSRLVIRDKLIKEARKSLQSKKHNRFYYSGIYNTSTNEIDIRVSPKNVGRSLRFMNTLIKLFRARGHEIKINHNKTCVVIEGQEINIRLTEKLKRIIIPGKYYNTSELHPTGSLSFRFDDYFEKHLTDGKLLLEEQLPRLLARLELLGKKKMHERLELEECWRIQAEKRRIEEELKARKEKDLLDFKSLFTQAERYQRAQYLHDYINAFEVNAKSTNTLSDEIKQWLSWARQKADWYDPFINAPDELLADIEKDEVFQNSNKHNSWSTSYY